MCVEEDGHCGQQVDEDEEEEERSCVLDLERHCSLLTASSVFANTNKQRTKTILQIKHKLARRVVYVLYILWISL